METHMWGAWTSSPTRYLPFSEDRGRKQWTQREIDSLNWTMEREVNQINQQIASQRPM